MSRRKRTTPVRSRPVPPAKAAVPAASGVPPRAAPRPPRPNGWLLLAATSLLVLWIAMLVIMAVAY